MDRRYTRLAALSQLAEAMAAAEGITELQAYRKIKAREILMGRNSR